jgi:hypothetical protein
MYLGQTTRKPVATETHFTAARADFMGKAKVAANARRFRLMG